MAAGTVSFPPPLVRSLFYITYRFIYYRREQQTLAVFEINKKYKTACLPACLPTWLAG